MAKKLFCVVLIVVLVVGISGIAEASNSDLCDVNDECRSTADCSVFNNPNEAPFVCCQIGRCGDGVGYCC
ncbi:hypothetical protein SUGI_0847360 [Cryptomeria japonica]|nr:hypothetical protein SUGI_0847360 [Cryptomeria japonica]